MNKQPKGPKAARTRQRKHELMRRFNIPDDLFPGSLSMHLARCGKANCHCKREDGHPIWQLTFMVDGKKRVQHIPKHLVEEVQRKVKAGREYQDALREVMTANVELMILARKQRLI